MCWEVDEQLLVGVEVICRSVMYVDLIRCIYVRNEARDLCFLLYENTFMLFWLKVVTERHLKVIRVEDEYTEKKFIYHECLILLQASIMKSRRGFRIQRLMNAMGQENVDGWWNVFDNITFTDDRLESLYENTNAQTDSFSDNGRMALTKQRKKAKKSHENHNQNDYEHESATINDTHH